MSGGADQRVAVADIGGTNARFAIAERIGAAVQITNLSIFNTQDYRSFAEAWKEYAQQADVEGIGELGVSFAGPVGNSPVRLTNGAWTIDQNALAELLGFRRVKVVNDLAAIARSLPAVPNSSFEQICGPVSDRPPGPLTSVVGLGTGLGLALLLESGPDPVAVACEGGHIGYAPQSELDSQVFSWLRARYGRVSAERVVSGNALPDLIEALGGQVRSDRSTVDLWVQSIEQGDEISNRALDILLANLGSVAGDFMLAQGSQSVVLAGGLMGRLKSRLSTSTFAHRFYAKGRLSDHIAGVPVFHLASDSAGLIGAALSVQSAKEQRG